MKSSTTSRARGRSPEMADFKFRVSTVSCDLASHTGDFFHMTFAKLSEGGSSPTFGGCDQLLLAPRSKIANCCGIALR
jgi:hypothetical protein